MPPSWDLKSVDHKVVRVRLPPSAPQENLRVSEVDANERGQTGLFSQQWVRMHTGVGANDLDFTEDDANSFSEVPTPGMAL
jgi:hypothetical protein